MPAAKTYWNDNHIRIDNIEDDLLITDTAHRLLGKPIPKTIEEIEH